MRREVQEKLAGEGVGRYCYVRERFGISQLVAAYALGLPKFQVGARLGAMRMQVHQVSSNYLGTPEGKVFSRKMAVLSQNERFKACLARNQGKWEQGGLEPAWLWDLAEA